MLHFTFHPQKEGKKIALRIKLCTIFASGKEKCMFF